MFRALLRPSMKRQARGPVSNEQKAQQAQVQAEVQAKKQAQGQMQIPDQNHTQNQKLDDNQNQNQNQSANPNPTMIQSQVQLQTQLPVASTSTSTAALLLDPLNPLDDQEKTNETATHKTNSNREIALKEPEQDSVESGAQGDNEQSDSELPASSNCQATSPHPLPLPKSRSISITKTMTIPLPLPLPRPLHNRQDLPDEGGNPEQLKSLAGREQIAKLLLTRLGEGAGAEGDGEANQIVMELLGGRDSSNSSSHSSSNNISDTTSDISGTGNHSNNDANMNDNSSNNATIPATMPSPSAIERVSEQLMRVLREQTLNEAGIAIGNERYRCFKCVLQNYAKIYAARRFMEQLPQLGPQENGQSQAQSPGTQSQSAQGQSSGDEADQELLARVVADEIPELLRQLWSSLEKMEFFNEDTAFKAYLEARRHPQARILRELMLTRISRVFLCIVSSTFFLDFTEHELTHILRNCYLSVNSEIEVGILLGESHELNPHFYSHWQIFLSVVLWLEHNWYERRECAERILAQVRFGLMPTWYLATLDRANRCRHFSRVIQSPGVQRMIAQGLELVHCLSCQAVTVC